MRKLLTNQLINYVTEKLKTVWYLVKASRIPKYRNARSLQYVVYGTTNAVYGTTDADAGVGIGMKIIGNLIFNGKTIN